MDISVNADFEYRSLLSAIMAEDGEIYLEETNSKRECYQIEGLSKDQLVEILDNEGNAQFIVESLTGGKEPPFMIGTKLARMKVWAALTGKTLGGILKRELSSRE